MTRLGGSFDTTAYLDTLDRLQVEAQAQGFRITPAPATDATTKFNLGTVVLEDERLKADCQIEVSTITRPDGSSSELRIPNCTIEGENGEDLDTNIMYSFSTFPVPGNSVVSQRLPFSAVTTPDVGAQLRPIMQSGGQWDGVLSATVDWKIKTNTQTRQARAIIRWSSVFEQASAYFAIHNNACIDVEVETFFQNLATCDDPDLCGVKLEYLDPTTNQWSQLAPNDPDFIVQVNEFAKNIENELFNQVDAYSKSELGRVSKESKAYFTLKANYEKLSLNRNETRYFTWTPGNKTVNARTNLAISCLQGGFEMGRVTWNTADPGCMALLGQ